MGIFGNLLGQGLGHLGEAVFGKTKGIDGAALGGGLGATLIPYKTGGAVKRTGPALLHKGEYVLSANAKPTKAQRAIVNKNKAAAKKRKSKK